MPYVLPLTTLVFQMPGKKSSRLISFDWIGEAVERRQRIERDELRHPGIAEHGDVGRGVADVGREELLVRGGPRDLLDFDVDVGVLFLESGDELGEDFALSTHGPDAKSGLVSGGGGRTRESDGGKK